MRNFILKKSGKYLMFLVIVTTLFFVACSDNGDEPIKPPELATNADTIIPFPSQDEEFDENLIVVLPIVNFSATSNPQTNVQAVPISHFVLEHDSENFARMHTYQIFAHDGINSRRNGNEDLDWDAFQEGYFLNETIRTYFHDISQKEDYSFNIQLAREIRMYRSIYVVKPDGEEVLFQVNILRHENRSNPQNNNYTERAFRMSDLITGYITKTPQNYEYFITSTDYTGGNTGYAILQWSDIQAAWYSRNIDRVFFPQMPSDMPGAMRLRDVIKVELRAKNTIL